MTGTTAAVSDPFTGNRYAFTGGNPISGVEADGHTSVDALCDGVKACNAVTVGRVPGPSRAESYQAVENFMFAEMKGNLESDAFKEIKHYTSSCDTWNPIQYTFDCDPGRSIKLWFDQVQENGPWDHKNILLKNFGLHEENGVCCYSGKITGMNAEVYHDVWSNVHYGYVGAATGLDDVVLETAAAPSLPGGKNIPGAEHIPYVGRTDEGDKMTVRFGIALWKKYGADLTQGQFHSELLNMFGDLQGTDKIYSLTPPRPTMDPVPGGWI
ncbi:polymorphic toxin type 44 domain-containing protein [Streptomyces sp. NPDC001698]|uniref:polymorphic toxin type 44 domain-containing protein n=1 Tax=Streptomyces sp. NPDC001698 TaxID=3364601 RepID=UPI0036A0797C